MKLVLTLIFLIFACTSELFAAVLYTQPCRNINDDYLQFKIETAEKNIIDNSGFVVKVTAFEDVDCKVPYLNYIRYFKVIKFQNSILNLKVDKITYTALTNEVATALRMTHYCDFSNWQISQEIAVTGKTCDGFKQFAKNDTYFQILKKSVTNLQFGAEEEFLDGKTPEHRPVHFDELDYTSN